MTRKRTVSRDLCFCLITALLTACGGGSGSSDSDRSAQEAARCESVVAEVQWNKLLTENAPQLSDYQLFRQPCNPAGETNSGGFPYDLTSALFTDYATKYRYIFIPPGERAEYSEQEALEFPVGTVLVKTFALPRDTSIRGYEAITDSNQETLIETRLLIRREGGWIALPYLWNAEQTSAALHLHGKSIPVSVVHNGQQKDFSYVVPDIQTCKQCHQLTDTVNGEDTSRFTLLGPKARLLNRTLDYGILDDDAGEQNQLAYMIEHDLLEGAPADLTTIDTVPVFTDETDISDKTPAELEAMAKGYLDINCAHCHRRTGAAPNVTNDGKAGYSGLKVEYWRSFEQNRNAHGVCKLPIAFSVQGLAFDIVPGHADRSVLPYRMELRTAKKMPEVGRDLVHEEGTDLIKAWINSMPAIDCGQE